METRRPRNVHAVEVLKLRRYQKRIKIKRMKRSLQKVKAAAAADKNEIILLRSDYNEQ